MVDPTVWREFGTPLSPPTGRGPLDGMTVAVKELFDVAGYPVGAGNEQWLAESRPATSTAPVVAALLEAGAAIAGIARCDEFAYSLAGTNSHYGTPPNRRAPNRIPGGSSSGSGSAVASGEATIGLGTDTAGSIRVPASYLGLFGIRSTHGAIALDGVLPLAPTFDAVGWMTRDSGTLLAVGETLLPPCPPRLFEQVIVSEDLTALASPAVRDAVGAAVVGWESDPGLPRVERLRLDTGGLAGWAHAFRTVQGFQAWREHGGWISRHWDSLGPDVRARFEAAANYTEAQWIRAADEVRRIAVAIDSLLGDDLLLVPSASSVAPTRTEASLGGTVIEAARAATFQFTCIAGLTGRCAVNVPLPTTDGIPVGLGIVGPRGRDLDLLRLADRVRAAGIAVGWANARWPGVVTARDDVLDSRPTASDPGNITEC
ncbi:amidase [Rhodococcus sp. PvR099]|uniref:amidase n=1 Tax=Rhodococcus sp. PvR099 TaxID=2806602 RepID=UPI001B3F8B3D|nr:amidase [Rhodococcus sp. PvR099]MBP1160830.1 Asp-tRNA(Asn)/Glu-tRNA(Gln) amidotransferase A subunit family amidase [Rhodococcus sp. PvR099]